MGLQKAVAEVDLIPEIIVVMHTTAVTVRLTVWMALPIVDRIVLFNSCWLCFRNYMVINSRTNSFRIALKIKSVIGDDAIRVWLI